jgi:hypothetical protein
MTPRWLASAGQCKRPRSPQGPEPLLIGIAATSDPAKLVSRRLHRPQQPVYGRASEKTHSWQAATHMRLALRSPRVMIAPVASPHGWRLRWRRHGGVFLMDVLVSWRPILSFERKWIGPERMTYGQGFNSDSTLCSDNRRAKANTKCIDCGCLINRGLRCGPCRDIADERRRQEAYAAKKAARDKL